MAIKINFDVEHNPEEPTLILAKKNGDKLGKINAKAIEISDNLNDASEITFNVYKYIDDKKDSLWDLITNFKLVYCLEMDEWFEATVEVDESNETMKTVFCTQLGHAELGQIMLYDIAINTDGEDGDIARDDYVIPTVLYRENGNLGEGITDSDVKFYKETQKKEMKFPFEDYKEASLLHRILKDKAPHYSIAYVDPTISHMQRTFKFDDTSICDALAEIAEEINCIFVFSAYMDDDGIFRRTISAYDLESNCLNPDCKHRGDFVGVCPKCGGKNVDNEVVYGIDEGYGEDTTIFVTSDEIADSIQLTTDVDSIKNCFKLEAGDDPMTATIKSCNPNGSEYIWHLSDEMMSDMSDELVTRINEYNKLYEQYQTNEIDIDESFLSNYNELVNKYNILMNRQGDEKLETIESPIKGFSSLIDAYYNTFDMHQYLESELMPTIDIARPSIEDEIAKLTAANLSPIAVNVTSSSSNPLKAASISTVDTLVLNTANTLIDSRYEVKIADNSTLGFYIDGEYLIDTQENKNKYEDGMLKYWRGNFILTADSDDKLSKSTNDDNPSYYIEIEVNDDYETYVKRKLDKALSAEDADDMSISGLFKKDLAANFITSDGLYFMDSDGNLFVVGAKEEESFQYALKQYSLNRLKSFQDACQSCIDIMIEQGVADGNNMSDVIGADLYNELYMVYCNKMTAITEEIAVRDSEIATIIGVYDEDGDLVIDGLQTLIEKAKSDIQKKLDFKSFLVEVDEKLWLEFCSFRREDKYSNDNYISEGKNNAEIIDLAKQFVETAKKEIYKSAERQHSISASLKNLLVIKKFEPLVKHFKVGNWLRVMIDDQVYRLRLINYEIDYGKLDGISVEFSDTVKANSSIKSVKDVLTQASSMATSYSSVQRQASKGEESKMVINDWFSSGLDATNVKIVGGADGQSQTWDNHGMLFREYDESTGEYSPEQMKIINSTMAITTDNWNTTKTAVGKYYYKDSKTGKLKMAYGINAETIVGKLIIGETIELNNANYTMTFDDNGLIVKNDTNTVAINPDADSIFNIKNGDSNILSFDEDGNLVIVGDITASRINLIEAAESGNVTGLSDVAISGSYSDLIGDSDKVGQVLSLDENDGITTTSLETVATSGSYTDLINVPTKLSQFTNDGVFITKDVNNLTNYYKKTETNSLLESKANTEDLANVATSGKYTDLTGEVSDVGKLLYIGNDGNVTSISIDDLKELLGI